MWPSNSTNNYVKHVACNNTSSHCNSTLCFSEHVPLAPFHLIFTSIFKIVNDIYTPCRFPIWFLPPNEPAKFPQILNYVSAFYKHAVVKFSFFFPLPTSPFLEGHSCSSARSYSVYLLRPFCCPRKGIRLPN